MKDKKINRSILPAPDMNYNRFHLCIAYIIMGLALLGLVKLAEIISYFLR